MTHESAVNDQGPPWLMLPYPTRKATWRIVVHCSATPAGKDFGAKDIDAWHRQRGFKSIGYHYVIRLDGDVERGRPQEAIGAHAEGYNSTSVAVCLIGGVDADDINKAENTFTPQQMVSLKLLLDKLMEQYPQAVLYGHRDLPGVHKACPSFNVRKWWKDSHAIA